MALTEGVKAGNADEWVADIEDRTAKLVDWAVKHTESLATNQTAPLRILVDALSHGPHASLPACADQLAPINRMAAEKLLQAVVLLVDTARGGSSTLPGEDTAKELKAVKDGRPLLADAQQYLLRARELATCADQLGTCEELDQELDELEETLNVHAAILDSTMRFLIGEAQLHAAVKGSEEINIDGVWEALDSFKAAVVAAREKDLECEAAALSRMGTIFKDLLKIQTKAEEAFQRSLELALAAAPRTFYNKAWFAVANAEVFEKQQRKRREEEAAESKEEKELLAGKDEECKAIDKAFNKGAVALLEHVYKHHPPAKGGTLGSVSADDLKKTLRNAVTHYHPDKQPGADKVAAALASYICKRLSAKYNMMKNFD